MELAFEEDFENSTLDLSKWDYVQPWGNHSEDGFNASLEYQTDGLNYEFIDGTIKLIIRKEKIYAKAINHLDSAYLLKDGLSNLRWWDYTAGMIYSKESFGYGKYEMRCKIPKGKGFWSVFWLFGIQNEEIDVFEFWNERSITGKYAEEKLCTRGHMTTHANERMCESSYQGKDFSESFHVYSVIWTNNKIEWYVDGDLKRTSYKFYSIDGKPLDCKQINRNMLCVKDKTFPLYPEMHISVSLGLQPGKNAPDDSTPFPSSIEVDYIKFYKFK